MRKLVPKAIVLMAVAPAWLAASFPSAAGDERSDQPLADVEIDAGRPDAASPVTRKPATFRPGDHWVGTYVCAQGVTNLDLQIVSVTENAIQDAIFDFNDTVHGAAGSYHMTGTFNPTTRQATFTAGAWIHQPPRFVTVDMKGKVDGATFSGDISGPGCTTFEVSRRQR